MISIPSSRAFLQNWVRHQNVHPQCRQPRRHHPAHAAKANDSCGLAVQFPAEEQVAIPAAGGDVLGGLWHMADQGKISAMVCSAVA